MASDITVPEMGESITEAVILRWIKNDGDSLAADEPICELETDKATFDLPAPASGVLKIAKEAGATVRVGEAIGRVEEALAEAVPNKSAAPVASESPPRAPRVEPAQPARPAEPSGQASRSAAPMKTIAAESASPLSAPSDRSGSQGNGAERRETQPATKTAAPATPSTKSIRVQAGNGLVGKEGTRRVPMTKIRRRIAERLVRAQQTAAMLTTFNEIDMTTVLDLREKHKEQFERDHGVSLGLMSFFSRACVLALKQFPAVNAEIDGDDILYHDHVHLGIAVNTERGLVVPVVRHAETMSFARLEAEIKRVALAARDGKLALQELSGGTFTITNGGVFGSLLSTPILNPPQTGILGMHTIQKRPVVINDRIKARRMMYVALSYDHRLVDGRDAVMFLVKLKKLIEEPLSMMLEE